MPTGSFSRRYSNGIEIENLDEGLLVRQGNEAYVARNWQISSATEELIESVIRAGLGCMIREDHPRRNARWPNKRGVVYLAFSPSTETQWSLAIDTFRLGRGDYSFAVFNGKYQAQFINQDLPFVFEARNKGAGHLVVGRKDVIPTINRLAGFDHTVLAFSRSEHDGEGFTTEYVLQRQIMTNWAKTPWADRYNIVQDEFPVDGGLTSRRIDILARNKKRGDWLIIELKRAEASIAAVQQVVKYLRVLAQRDDFADGRLTGALVAERVSGPVRVAAMNEGVEVYEAHWPIMLTRVA